MIRAAFVGLVLAGCGSSSPPAETVETTDTTSTTSTTSTTGTTGATTGTTDPGSGGDPAAPPPPTPSGADDPRISTSAGPEGGIVVLWPRVTPASDSVPAADVQAALRVIAERAAAGRPVEVRPDPERACPQAGCRATALGAVLLHSGNGCAVVATVSAPGRTPQRLVAWVGNVNIRTFEVPFRQPPEGHVRIDDFASCAELAGSLQENTGQIETTLRTTMP